MYFKEMVCQDWTYLTQDRLRSHARPDDGCSYLKAKTSMRRWDTVSFAARILHHDLVHTEIFRLSNVSVQSTTKLRSKHFEPRNSPKSGVQEVDWRLVFVGPQFGNCFMSPFWRPEFWTGFLAFWKISAPMISIIYQKKIQLLPHRKHSSAVL
jgi:hypothetical protein